MLASPAPAERLGVLIVDESEDTREVLRAALERRGVATWEAAEARRGMELARQHHPQVIVLDVETIPAEDEDIRQELAAARRPDTAVLVLGRARDFAQALPQDRIVPKPYHYAPLIRTIESMLGTSVGA